MPDVATRADAVRIEDGAGEILSLGIPATLPGVIVLAVSGLCGSGVAYLRSMDGYAVQFKAPGSTAYGSAIIPAVSGEYLLEDGENADKWCRVHLYPNYFAVGSEARLELIVPWDNGFVDDDVTASEASAGATLTHTVDIVNDSGLAVNNLAVWLEAGGGIDAISDDGITWVSPTDEDSGLSFGTIAASGSATLHIKRVIGVGEAADPRVECELHCRWYN